MNEFILLSVIFVAFLCAPELFAEPQPKGGALAGERFRVIISSDIGGSDNDDFQSMIHFMLYLDLFDIEGFLASPPGNGRAKHYQEVIDAYAQDYPQLKLHAAYPEPKSLRPLVKQGAVNAAPAEGYSTPSDASKWLIQQAHVDDPRPLYVLIFGSITDIAQAIHDDPSIKETLRIYSIGSWNTSMDKAARYYLFNHHTDLWWIEADSTFRGMYVGGKQSGDLGNKSFLHEHVRGHGALGELLVNKLDAIKMGDTPSLLYFLRGNVEDPSSPHWGGAFEKRAHGPNYWTDNPDPSQCEKNYPGAKTVNQWRAAYLRDWQTRMDRVLP